MVTNEVNVSEFDLSTSRTRLTCRLCIAAVDEDEIKRLSARIIQIKDRYPVLPGHSLLITRRHVGSFAEALRHYPLDAKDVIDDFVSAWHEAAVGPAIFFEHGVVRTSLKPGCIDHAHVHSIPIPSVCRVRDVLRSGIMRSAPSLTWVPHVTHTDLAASVYPSEYLWIADSAGNSMYTTIADSTTVPHQLIRQVMAEIFGLTQWNWRSHQAMNLTSRD